MIIKMRKIIFINPPSISETDFSAKQSVVPPEGLCLLSACVREKGYLPSIIDSDALNLSIDDVFEKIKKEKPSFVGLTSTTITIHNCAELARKIRKLGIKVIVGGPHMNVAGSETMEHFKDCFDIGVYGEAEETIVELLNALSENTSLKEINGLIFFDKCKLIITSRREPIKDFDKIPMPAWDLLPDINKYYQQSVARADRFPSMSLMTSRGCPGQCIFCASEKNLRAYSSEKLIQIVKHLIKKYKIKSLEINDDNFIVFSKRLKDFCDTIINEKIDLTWSCMGRVNHVNEDILKMMYKAGCRRIAYGIESGSQKILDFERKGITLNQIRKAIEISHKVGIKTTGYFILGHPLETKESMQKTIDFANSLKLDDCLYSYMVPYPGTVLYEIAEEYGSFDKDWKKMYQWGISFIPNGLTKKDLENYFKKGFRSFYFRPRIIFNYVKKALNPRYTFKFIKSGVVAIKFILKGK